MRYFPPLALILINALVLFFVLRERDRTRAAWFMAINAVALMCYGTGQIIYDALDRSSFGVLIPAFASLMVPANYLLFATTHPKPITSTWGKPFVLFIAFLPALGLMAFTDYSTYPQRLLGFRVDFTSDVRDSAWLLGTYVYFTLWSLIAMWVFAIRYRSAPQGPERDLAKHLVSAVFGALLFAVIFWFSTRQGWAGVLPSPTLLGAIMAQIGIFLVFRQLDFERPLFLTRSLYFTIAGVTAFLFGAVLLQLYEIVALRPIMGAANQSVTLAIAVTLVMLLATFPTPQAWFDRIFFRRAYEYRRLVLEAQRELRETQERLRRAERLSMVGELAARIAHEIKNPLGPIKGYTQMLREKIEVLDELPQREQMLSHLAIIAEEVGAIDRKVHTLLDLARRPLLERHILVPNAIMERTATLLRLEIAGGGGHRRKIEVETDLSSGLPEITADRTRVEEALLNLGRNALDAVEDGGRVSLSTREARSEAGVRGVAFLIRDNGPGLSEEAQAKLFTPFFTEKPGGTGLGLAICKAHADEHGGEISLRRVSSGGTEARFWLPLDPADAVESQTNVPNVHGPLPLESSADARRAGRMT